MNRRIALALISCILPFFCHGIANEQVYVEADYADYNSQDLVLKNNVKLDHALGRVFADYAVAKQEDGCFQELKLKHNVKIRLKDGAELDCAKAKIDYDKLKATLKGDPKTPFVHYQDTGLLLKQLQEERIAPLKFQAKRMELKLREEANENGDEYLVEKLHALDEVTVVYNQNYSVHAHQATYQRLPEGGSEQDKGQIHLLAKDQTNPCTVSKGTSDRIAAQSMDLDLATSRIYMHQANGHIQQAGSNDFANNIHFQANEIAWHHAENFLELREQVHVSPKGLGELRSQDRVYLSYTEGSDGEIVIKEAKTQGPTHLIYQGPQDSHRRILNCSGPITMDHENGRVLLERSQSGTQVAYIDRLGKVYANEIQMEYQETPNGELELALMKVQGDVKIVNYSTNKQGGKMSTQYALAHQVEYQPNEEKMILSATPGNKVLYLDQGNEVRMVAPSVEVFRLENGEEAIKGVGHVRFEFRPDELMTLQEEFQMDVPL